MVGVNKTGGNTPSGTAAVGDGGQPPFQPARGRDRKAAKTCGPAPGATKRPPTVTLNGPTPGIVLGRETLIQELISDRAKYLRRLHPSDLLREHVDRFGCVDVLGVRTGGQVYGWPDWPAPKSVEEVLYPGLEKSYRESAARVGFVP